MSAAAWPVGSTASPYDLPGSERTQRSFEPDSRVTRYSPAACERPAQVNEDDALATITTVPAPLVDIALTWNGNGRHQTSEPSSWIRSRTGPPGSACPA